MQILILNGSAKGEKSHSYKTAMTFAEGISEKTGATIKTLELFKMNIGHCRGCFSCWKVTPGKCAIRDDMDIVSEEILASEYIILSFPLYCFSVSSITATVIDRLLPFKLPYNGRHATDEKITILDFRHDFSGKKLILVSSCAHASTEYVYESVKKQFDLITGPGNYTTIFTSQGEILELEQMKPIYNAYLRKVYAAGEEMAETGELCEQTLTKVNAPLIPKRAVEKMMTGYWENMDTKKGE